MQLSEENFEYFAGREDLVNQILDRVREEGMQRAQEREEA